MLDRQRPLILLALLVLPALGLLALAPRDTAAPVPHASPQPLMLAQDGSRAFPSNGDFALVIDEALVGPLHATSQAANCLIVTTNGTTSVSGGFLSIARSEPIPIPEEIPRPLELLIGAPMMPTASTTGALPFSTVAPAFDLWHGIEARFLVRLPDEGPRVAAREALTMSVAFVTEGDPLVFRVGGCA